MRSEKFQFARGNLRNPRYLFVGEAWGAEEEKAKKPFIGSAGKLLTKCILSAGIPINTCAFTNIMDKRPVGNDFRRFLLSTKLAKEIKAQPFQGLYPRPELQRAADNLWHFIAELDPEFIIPLGNYPTWFFVGDRIGIVNQSGYKVPSGISKWRGSQLLATNPVNQKHYKVMPTYHPAAVLRSWEFYIDVMRDLRDRLFRSWEEPEYNFIVNPTVEEAIQILQSLPSKLIAVDIEIAKDKTISCIGIAWSERDAICIPTGKYSHEERMRLALFFHDFFKDKKIIGQNFLFDAQYLFHYYLLYLPPYYDTMHMRHLLAPGTPLDLNYLSSIYCSFHRYWKDEGKEFHKSEGELRGWIYNCKDCVATYEIAMKAKAEIELEGMTELYDFQRKQADMILRMMLRGVRIDLERKQEVLEELNEEIKKLEGIIRDYVPADMVSTDRWFNSPKQLMELFYDRLNIRPVRKPTGSATVDEEALEKIAKREPLVADLINLLRHYRKLKKFRDFVKLKVDEDGRMRCEFSPTAETFRWKSRRNVFGGGGNLQNLPKGGEFE